MADFNLIVWGNSDFQAYLVTIKRNLHMAVIGFYNIPQILASILIKNTFTNLRVAVYI
jgi:hypothetical protein